MLIAALSNNVSSHPHAAEIVHSKHLCVCAVLTSDSAVTLSKVTDMCRDDVLLSLGKIRVGESGLR